MMKLLTNWKTTTASGSKITFLQDGQKPIDEITNLDEDDQEVYENIQIIFDTDVVFCLFSNQK